MKVLNLGCGSFKIPESFNVDFDSKYLPDLVWNLEEKLPEKHFGVYDKVHAFGILEHLGNPLNFLKDCNSYLKPDGILELKTDNATFWRYHIRHSRPFKFFGSYHASIWDSESSNKFLGHKMLFQKEHLQTLFNLAGFESVEIVFDESRNFLDRVVEKFSFFEQAGCPYLIVSARKHLK